MGIYYLFFNNLTNKNFVSRVGLNQLLILSNSKNIKPKMESFSFIQQNEL